MKPRSHQHSIAIACGGTGGHLFPGLAIADKLLEAKIKVTLIISQKEVDQQAVSQATGCQILALPAVGLGRGKVFAFSRGFRKSYLMTKRLFRYHTPDAVLGMGGFTSAAPILAGKAAGAHTFLHESNAIPGRANRWLSRLVDHAFVGFPDAATLLKRCPVRVSGTPVREQFREREAASCRAALGLDGARPMALVVGGSQGASGINRIVAACLPVISKLHPEWQWFHLTGAKDIDEMKTAYAKFGLKAVVHAFFDDMDLALGASTLAISRAGASSLAELAAMRVPALLIPYPAAADNHQWFNARAYSATGAAQVLAEREASQERVTALLRDLVENQTLRRNMQSALARWQQPDAAGDITQHMLEAVIATHPRTSSRRFWPLVRSIPMETREAPVALRKRRAGSSQEQPARV